MIAAVSLGLLVLLSVPLGYLLALALAAIRPASPVSARRPTHRFAIVVPAHDEEAVIGHTVRTMFQLDYPRDLFDVYVVADHCSDDTAGTGRRAGAIVHERNEGPRTGKGAALSWLFDRVLDSGHDVVAVFDADTQVDRDFLRVMDARFCEGADAVQGQHVISNSRQGRFAALTWAMFLVDNRFQNLGRSNLGLSAKNMGDSICIRSDVLKRIGWGEGLTEDYQLRHRLLLDGVRIVYEPTAVGRGEAVPGWREARPQRARWLRGTRDASRKSARQLLVAGLERRNPVLLDGALQSYLPSYSTLTVISLLALTAHLITRAISRPLAPRWLTAIWAVVVAALGLYPLAGLALERAPLRAYLVVLSGAPFVFWRTWLAVTVRARHRSVAWIRTRHGG